MRALFAALAVPGLLVGGCGGDGGEGRARAEAASPKPPVELNDELTVSHVTQERAVPCQKKELEHRNMCYRVSDGFSTRRVKGVEALMPDPEKGRTWAAVQVDFESPEAALLAEMTEKANKIYIADPYAPGAKIAVVYGGSEVVAVAPIINGPLTSGGMEVDPGLFTDEEARDLVARMTA
ncbi:hypothetical protein [Actinocorallia populi]|uniref:hypothetical protein n=1 Tax=Actinocorallia populi TaxID=2079200 RepID=UPI001300B955|nr:hypothetical protein [Actinocorallia populi]